jgi:hypothetical protein
MNLRSPFAAILWEIWRVTRAEAARKLAFGIVGGLAVLALFAAFAPTDDAKRHEDITDIGAAIAMTLLVLPHLMSWSSLASLNSARAGFPLYLQYSRPVKTSVIVGLAMVYLVAMSSAIYLASALLLRLTSGYAFPLLPVAAWIMALTLVLLAASWSIRNKTLRTVVMVSAVVKGLGMAIDRLTAIEIPDTFDWPPRLWPSLFDFPSTDYAVISVIGVAAFWITTAAVTRQRRGDERPDVSQARRGGPYAWLVNLFPFSCPTSSSTRAQVWFDLKSNGLPLLAIGVALAILIVLLSAFSGTIDAAINADPDASCPIKECFYARAFPPLLAPFSLVVILFLSGNAFGIRRRRGRTYVTAFEATLPHGAAQLALLKVLVKSACVLAAIIAIGVSVWISMPLLGDAVFIQMWNVPLSSRVSAIPGVIASLTGYEQLALAILAIVGVVFSVAASAVLAALWTRYPRRAIIMAVSLLLSGIALVVLAVAEIVSPFVIGAILAAARWTIFLAVVYVFWSGFAERVLTMRYASGAVAVSAAFGAAWLTLLNGMPPTNAVSLLWAMLLPLMVSVLAPWSLSRLRHT